MKNKELIKEKLKKIQLSCNGELSTENVNLSNDYDDLKKILTYNI